MNSIAEDMHRAKFLRAELRTLEESLQRRTNQSPITREDELLMQSYQSRFDEAYTALSLRAPPPLPFERPEEYRRRLMCGLQPCSETLKNANLDLVSNDVLDVLEPQLIQAARADAVSPRNLPPGKMRAITKRTDSGHTETTWIGNDTHFVRQFTRPARYVRLPEWNILNQVGRG